MMPHAKQLSFEDARVPAGWGGWRPGAGRRPASKRPPVHHVRRLPVPRHCPSHVTLRVHSGLSSLRSRRFLEVFRRSLRQACERRSFPVVHYSVQRNHVHLLVESAGKEALGNGMKAVAARMARAVNRAFDRSGRVLYGRYHLRVLRTPREVRNALAYVLLNARKHRKERYGTAPPVRDPPEVAGAHTWLLAIGWRRHGLVDPAEVPGA